MSAARKIRRQQEKILSKQVRSKKLPEASSLQEALSLLKVLSSQLDDMQTAMTQLILDRDRHDAASNRLRAVLIRMLVEERKRLWAENAPVVLFGNQPDPIKTVLAEVAQYQMEFDGIVALAQLGEKEIE